MEHNHAIKEWEVGLNLHKLPKIKYPFCTHRAAGRTWPGEVVRQTDKARMRKTVRNSADMFCKFMLFKKGKFMPGKMI